MYSLYRAWLMRDALAAAQPADVVVSVGGGGQQQQQFAAHRAVLAAHSGYLKALLATAAGPAVCVPSVGSDAFAPLLTFMYTGVLDLNRDNIYSVLLATHLLHMPRALDLCRAYLQQPPPAPAPGPPPPPPLVKPVPSRKLPLLGLPYWPPPPPPPLLAHAHGGSSFRCVSGLPPGRSPPPPSPPPEPSTSRPPPPPSVLPGPAPGPSTAGSSSPAPGSMSPCLSASSRSDSSPPRHGQGQQRPPQPPPAQPKHRKADDGGGTSGAGKVIIDVACCDGPVRFHRVLNDNYGLLEADTPPSPPPPEASEASASATPARHQPVSSTSSAPADGVYTCVYCNHTFKSHYCYQKHARRHINPVSSLHAVHAKKHRQQPPQPQQPQQGSAPRREVRLLDMNVQYYPCKTCGSKFPSYYFVHKHRKMCHAGEDSDSATGASDESRSQPTATTA